MQNRDKNDEALKPPKSDFTKEFPGGNFDEVKANSTDYLLSKPKTIFIADEQPAYRRDTDYHNALKKEYLTKIFNEWNKRYSKNPDEFSDSLDENGKTISDYGESCAVYFQKISYEVEKVTVCDKCFRACCWQGVFMCDESMEAGTVQKIRKELIDLKLEHPSYLLTDDQLADQ